MSETIRDIRTYATGSLDENCKFLGTAANNKVRNFESGSLLTFPPYTTVDRLALTPFNGRTAYDTDLHRAFVYEEGAWQTILTANTIYIDEDASGATLNLGGKYFEFKQDAPGALGVKFPELDSTPVAPAGSGYLSMNTFRDVMMFSGTNFTGGGEKWKGLTFVDAGDAIPDGNIVAIKENNAGTGQAYAAEIVDSGVKPADLVTKDASGYFQVLVDTEANIVASSPPDGSIVVTSDNNRLYVRVSGEWRYEPLALYTP